MKYNTAYEYCLVKFIFSTQEYYCLWFDNGYDDVFLTDQNNTLVVFADENEIRSFCNMHNLDIQESTPVVYDIDSMPIKLCSDEIDCNLFLNYWNITSDIARTFQESFIGDNNGIHNEIFDIYNKLFYEVNHPALKKDSGEIYLPVWTENEITLIKTIIDDSFRIFSKFLKFTGIFVCED